MTKAFGAALLVSFIAMTIFGVLWNEWHIHEELAGLGIQP